ncbi:MAG: DUF262 domain-containing protein [Deltaproteobacteria bacterium]
MSVELDDILIEEEVEEDEVVVVYDIATYPSDFTLSGIHKMWQDKDIEIPDFQREFVWTIKQSSLLIDSFLLGLPVPPVFFYIDEEHKNLVIDGQQRILSIVFYFDGYFGKETSQGKKQVFRLTGLDEKSPYHNNRFKDLSQADQRKLQNAVLRAINVRQLAPKANNTSIYHIFERLNTGGTALKPQEIRNCVFVGDFVRILRRMNMDKNWRTIIGKKNMDKHQKDIELILRLFALSHSWESYEKPMKEFLNVAMRINRNGDAKEISKFVELFGLVTELIIKKLGSRAFHIRGPLNTAVLDSVFCTLLNNFERIPDNLPERHKQLLKNEKFIECTLAGTTDTLVLKSRFRIANEILIL